MNKRMIITACSSLILLAVLFLPWLNIVERSAGPLCTGSLSTMQFTGWQGTINLFGISSPLWLGNILACSYGFLFLTFRGRLMSELWLILPSSGLLLVCLQWSVNLWQNITHPLYPVSFHGFAGPLSLIALLAMVYGMPTRKARMISRRRRKKSGKRTSYRHMLSDQTLHPSSSG